MRSRKHIRIPKVMNKSEGKIVPIFYQLIVLFFQLLNILLMTGAVSVFLWFTYTDRSYEFIWRARVWWSLCLCFIIFACVNGQGGIINWFLSNPRWQPIARLSFNIFLVHQTVIVITMANRKVPIYFSTITQVTNHTFRLLINSLLINTHDCALFRRRNCFWPFHLLAPSLFYLHWCLKCR